MINKARRALSEARFAVALRELLPKLDATLPPVALAEAAARLFKLADPRSVAQFRAAPPESMMLHQSSAVRALAARLSRGERLREALRDQSAQVRAAATQRLLEVGDTAQDTAPLADLSDEYYGSIAQRLVNDYPDSSGDWVGGAVAACVRSYRSTSGVQLDAEKLRSAVDARLAELGELASFSPLKEAIDALGEDDDQACDEDRRDDCEDSDADDAADDDVLTDGGQRCVVERAQLSAAVRRRAAEAGVFATDGPRRVIFEKKMRYADKRAVERIARRASVQLGGGVKVSWIAETPSSALISYRS